jgi:DNA-binding NtrC family response regulator
MDTPESLLIVGRDSTLFDLLKGTPVASEFRLFFCGVQENLPAFVKDQDVRYIILDAPDEPGASTDLLQALRRLDPLLVLIAVGRPLHPEEILEWISRGASDYLDKPVAPETVRAALAKAAEKRNLRRETLGLERKLEKKYVFQGLISKNPFMLEIFSLIESVAKHYTSVLIFGDTGTGKEGVARAVHALSETKNRRLVVCDCSSIPESLFE